MNTDQIDMINRLRGEVQKYCAEYVLSGIGEKRKLSLIPIPTSAGKTFMVVHNMVSLYLQNGCTSVIITVPQVRQATDFAEELRRYAKETNGSCGFTEDQVCMCPTLDKNLETIIQEEDFSRDSMFWKKIFPNDTNRTVGKGLTDSRAYLEMKKNRSDDDPMLQEKREKARAFVSSIWHSCALRYDQVQRKLRTDAGFYKENGLTEFSRPVKDSLLKLFPRELSEGSLFTVYVCTHTKLCMGLSRNSSDSVFAAPKKDRKTGELVMKDEREALIIDEFDKLYDELLRIQLDAAKKGIDLVRFLNGVYAQSMHLTGVWKKRQNKKSSFEITSRGLRLDETCVKDAEKILSALKELAVECGFADSGDEVFIIPDFSVDEKVFFSDGIGFYSGSVRYISSLGMSVLYFLPDGDGLGQSKIRLIDERKLGKGATAASLIPAGGYELKGFERKAEKIVNIVVRMARHVYERFDPGTVLSDSQKRHTAADVAGVRDAEEQDIIARSIFGIRHLRGSSGESGEKHDVYAYGSSFTAFNLSPNHDQRVTIKSYRIGQLPSYLMRCLIDHFAYVQGLSATAAIEGVRSFNNRYIGTDTDGNPVLAVMKQEVAAQIEKRLKESKEILYGNRKPHVFMVPGFHKKQHEDTISVLNLETRQPVAEGISWQSLLNYESGPEGMSGSNRIFAAASVLEAVSVWTEHDAEGGKVFAVAQKAGLAKEDNGLSHLKGMLQVMMTKLPETKHGRKIRSAIERMWFGTVSAGNLTMHDPIKADQGNRVYRDPDSIGTDTIHIILPDRDTSLVLFVPEDNMRGYNYSFAYAGDETIYNLSGIAVRLSSYVINDIGTRCTPEQNIDTMAAYLNMTGLTGKRKIMSEFYRNLTLTHPQPKEPEALRDDDMSPYKSAININLTQTIGRLRMNDPGEYPLILIDEDIVGKAGCLKREQFTEYDEDMPSPMLSYEMECVLECADDYRRQVSSERTPSQKKADAWDAECESWVKGCIMDIAAAKESQDGEEMLDAIRSMEVVKLSVRNPDAGFVTDDWIRESVPDKLDIHRQDIIRMIRKLFAPADAYCLDDTKVRKIVFRIDSRTVKDSEFDLYRMKDELTCLETYCHGSNEAFGRAMPFWADLLCDGAHEDEDYALKWPGFCAVRQGISALIGETGEFATEQLIRQALAQNQDIREGLSIMTLTEKISAEERFVYEDCDIRLSPSVMIDVKNYREFHTILCDTTLYEEKTREARHAFERKVSRFPDRHIMYIFFMPYLPDSVLDELDELPPFRVFNAGNSDYVNRLCVEYGKDFEILMVSGVIPGTCNGLTGNWKLYADGVMRKLLEYIHQKGEAIEQ